MAASRESEEEAKILVVDDDDDLRGTLSELITVKGWGICISMASLADVDAHRAAVLTCPLAVLDINLGANEPSGLDVFDWLQRNHFTGRVVFLTGYGATDPAVQAAMSIAGTRTLTKPLGIGALAALVAEARGVRA